MILRTPVILGVCWLIGINTAIPFRANSKNIKQDIRQVNHPLYEENPRHFYQPPKRDKLNYEVEPRFQKGSDYSHEYEPTDDVYDNSESSEIYPDDRENYPKVEKSSRDLHKIFPKIQSLSNFRKVSQDHSSSDTEETSDSTEDYSQDDSYYSDENKNPKDSRTSAPENSTTTVPEESTLAPKESTSAPANLTTTRKTSPDPEIEAHLTENNVIEKWIPTNCSHSARKSSDRYSSSFVSNNTKDGLNEDTFPNPGEAEAIKSSSVFVGEDVTLCWIETITIKENKSIQPPKKVVLREFTISFENSATIPEKYLECGKLEGEVEPGCHAYGGKNGLFDIVDEDSKVSRLVNFTTVSNKGNIEVRQHKNVRCAVGPVVTKNVIEFKDGSKNPKKRVEVKVSPRLRRMSEAEETCPSNIEKIDVPPRSRPAKNLPKNKEKSNELGKKIRKPDGGSEEVGKKPEEGPDRIHVKPAEGPALIDKKPEEPHFSNKNPVGEHPHSKRPNRDPTTLEKSVPDYNEEDHERTQIGEIFDGSSTTYKNEMAEVENHSSSESPESPEGDDFCEGKSCKSKGTTQLPTHTRKSLKLSSGDKNTSEESTTPDETELKEVEVEGREPKSESCEGDSCEKCSGENCLTDSQLIDDSTEEIIVPDEPNTYISREDKVTENSIEKETSTLENDDANLRDSTTKEPPIDGVIPTDRKTSVDTETPNDTSEKHNKNKKKLSCSGEDCLTKIDESRTEGAATEKLPFENKTKEVLIPSDKTDTGKLRKSTTELPSNEEEKSLEELVSSPTSRKSSYGNTHPSDIEIESPAPAIQEPDSEKSEGHPTSLRPWQSERDVPNSWEEVSPKIPRHVSPHNLIRDEKLGKDLKCESGSCSTSLEGLTEFPERSTNSPEGEKESNKGARKSPRNMKQPSDDASESKSGPKPPIDTLKSPEYAENMTKTPKDTSKSSESPHERSESLGSTKKSSTDTIKSPESLEELLESPENTIKSPKDTSESTEAPQDVLKSETTTESPESERSYSKNRSEPEEIAEDTSRDLEETSPSSRSKNTDEMERNKNERKHKPYDIDNIKDTYSNEEETSHTPSFVTTTNSSSEYQSKDFTQGPASELKNRSGETILNRVSESTETSLIETTVPQCSSDEGCNSANKASSEPGLENKDVKENKKDKKIIGNKSVLESLSSGKHRLGLRIKIILEHINENEERKNLMEVDKHLLLNGDTKDNDNNTIVNQIKALNDSVTAQTIKALLNCSTLEKLTKKGISIAVDEAALIPKGKKHSKNLEPNEFILNVEDKRPDGENMAKLRKKREDYEDSSKVDSRTLSSTEENSTDANTADPISTVENSKEASREDNHIEAEKNKNQSEIIKDYVPDIRKDISTGFKHVISKLKNCTKNCSQELADVNLLPLSNILGIISDPKDSRIKSRNKRYTEDYRKGKNSFEKLDHWSNERIKRAAGGHHLRSLTEFTIFKEA